MSGFGSRPLEVIQKAGRTIAGTIGRESWLVKKLRPAYEYLLYWSSADHGISWRINDAYFRVHPRYRRLLGPNYETKVFTFLRDRVKPGSVCLDVGANVGVYVLQFANWAGPSGRVIAFEPNPKARNILLKHIQLNGLSKQVVVVPAAVGGRTGEAVLFAAGVHGMSRLGTPHPSIAHRVRPISVPVVTLDAFCEAQGLKPDWVLMDIEGYEIAALAGVRELISRYNSEIGVVVEMHPDVWDLAGTTRAEAESLLADLGLVPIPLTGQSDPLGENGSVFLKPRSENKVAEAALSEAGPHTRMNSGNKL